MLNPITYTEKVTHDFLRYQNTTHNFADPRLDEQMRRLLSIEKTRETPLMKGPYVSLSRLFQRGARVDDLTDEGVFHPELAERIPFERVYAHQERAIRGINDGRPTLVSTGTGSGKTEAFLYPIISRCLELRDREAPAGITAVLVYPMNALAQDQLERIRGLLAGTQIPFGLYIGKTPEAVADAEGRRLPDGAGRREYERALEQSDPETTVFPAEERISREEMRREGQQPRILLTNVKQLELLLTRQRDVELFDAARLEYLVLDEAHTFRGAMGGETACLTRRLRAYCDRTPDETVCIATSATIADPDEGEEDAQEFMSRLFGVEASEVCFVSEEYADQTWESARTEPPKLEGDPLDRLDKVLDALRRLDDGDLPGDTQNPSADERNKALRDLKTYVHTLTDRPLETSRWREHLYDILSDNEVVYQIARHLDAPKSLDVLAEELSEEFGRDVPAAEILTWMALGAAARRADRPLLRPVVHSFLRGVDGAVVTFPPEGPDRPDEPRLWLSADDAAEHDDTLFRFKVTTCTTCGQHYFPHIVAGFDYTGDEPGGGQADGHRRIWPTSAEGEGRRAVLIDSLAFAETTDMEQDPTEATDKVSEVYACRQCGTLHSHRGRGCGDCQSSERLIELYAIEQKPDRPGKLTSCVACGSRGRTVHGQYREPARPVRAVTVSDVHVVAQSMLQHAERERLLVFTDNRQDAAFQAGWMRDHARRFRLRSLMYEGISDDGTSVGDLTYKLDQQLEGDDGLSRALVPEVWSVVRRESSGQQHEKERRKFLRIQVLRELATSVRQRLGLESWGRLQVRYPVLEDHPFFEKWAARFHTDAERLEEGVAAWLDVTRRAHILYDRDYRIFSTYLGEDTKEVRHGYIPELKGGPMGLKFTRGANDDKNRVRQIVSSTGHETLATEMVQKWGLPEADVEEFWRELWEVLTEDVELLEEVTLTWPSGDAIRGCQGVYQIDADELRIERHKGLWRCPKCRRAYPRKTPRKACLGWRCDGELKRQDEPEDDYNLMLLDEHFSMVRPREHSAQVPNEQRERLEQSFKSSRNNVNTLVSTPTLELGVDIGSLDSVLMRNMPPLPANYWQRVGRAGRRHRMAVNVTYARPVTHDRAYFEEPLKMLDGTIEPPSFNLKNEVMVRKHVHATVIGYLYRIARHDDELTATEKDRIRGILSQSFPTRVRNYLFRDDGTIRQTSFDLSALDELVGEYRDRLLDHVAETFRQYWPSRAESIVTEERLGRYIDEMTGALREVIDRLEERLNWAHQQIKRLEKARDKKGALERHEEKLRERCARLIRRLKGETRGTNDAEGYDDTYTYSVLAAEGYLPGYGLDTGGVTAHHLASQTGGGNSDWTVRRPLSLAVREFIPGNMIYANGNRYAPRYFQLRATDPTSFHVDVNHEAVVERSSGESVAKQLSETSIDAVPVCDVELPHSSTISDDEEYRFQLPSAVYGYELDRHGPGGRHQWGSRQIELRDAVRLRLVNVGPSNLVDNGELGYPVCLVCGASRSPFASDSQLENFADWHAEHCGERPKRIGFYANIVADTLTLPDCPDRTEGYSVMEALRHGASRVLEMELEDLQLLALGRPGQEAVDMALYDPMPGGSGLLDQILERFDEVVDEALDVVEECPSACDRVCVDCLMTFRNMYYHGNLDRHEAADRLRDWGDSVDLVETIEAELPGDDFETSDTPEPDELLGAVLRAIGFGEPVRDHAIQLGGGQGTTEPDFFYPKDGAEGVCVYLGQPDGDDEQARRWQLDGAGYGLVEIPDDALTDPETLSRHLVKLAYSLQRSDLVDTINESDDWFENARREVTPVAADGGSETEENQPEPAPQPDEGWSFLKQLVGDEWRPVADALESADIPPPDDCLKGLATGGEVTETRALFVWERVDPTVALVPENGTAEVDSTGATILTFDDDTDFDDIVATLRTEL